MAVSVTYYVRGANVVINGSTTAPTQTQGALTVKQSAVIVWGAVNDTTALFTHNMGLDASAPTFFEPEVLFEPISGGTSWPLITFWRANTNVLVCGKAAGDAATTGLVTVRRPHSTGQ